MAIKFNDPQDKPFGRLSNSWIGLFYLDGSSWRSIEHYFQALKFLDPQIQNEIFSCRSASDAIHLAHGRQNLCRPDWDEIKDSAMEKLLQVKFSVLEFRSVLLKTGQEELIANNDDPYWGVGVDGSGQNKLGQYMMAVRDTLREKAEDISRCQCRHDDSVEIGEICVHLLQSYFGSYTITYCRRFTGRGSECILVCPDCAKASLGELSGKLWKICKACQDDLTLGNFCMETVGLPEFFRREEGLTLLHKEISIPQLISEQILDVKPVEEGNVGQWMVLTANQDLWRVDMQSGKAEKLINLTSEQMGFSKLEISNDGRFAAIYKINGRYGCVVDTSVMQISMRLDHGLLAGNRFPLSFFEMENRTLLIHATNLNRLDISDPCNGVLITKREFPKYSQEKPQPRFLVYFHGKLCVSPDGMWIAENGEIDHYKVGYSATWSLHRWLKENPWEADDGPSRNIIYERSYFEGGPLCWVDGNKLAVWGEGDDSLLMIPGVQIYDASKGEQIKWIAGPPFGDFYFDEYLFSCSDVHGMMAWNVETGECVFQELSLHPVAYSRSMRSFITILSNGVFRLSRLENK